VISKDSNPREFVQWSVILRDCRVINSGLYAQKASVQLTTYPEVFKHFVIHLRGHNSTALTCTIFV